VGRYLGKSLLVGYDEVLKAAVKFALERPEDADVNAMFAGLNLYRRLSKGYDRVEIAVVGGDSLSMIDAQRKVKG
jgi:putative membrane protein